MARSNSSVSEVCERLMPSPRSCTRRALNAWSPPLGTSALHAFTVGAIGTMILAVMTRATLGHTKQELTAGRGTLAIYLLVMSAAIMRILAPFVGTQYMTARD